MRVTSVELHPAGSAQVCVLSFRDPRGLNPYNVKGMAGLDGSDGIVSKFYGISENSVAKFYNLSLMKREVVMRISLKPQFSLGKTYSDLRDDLYRMIASSRTGLIEIQFKDGADVVAVISGITTKLEAPHFEQTPEVQITLNAVDPWLKGPTSIDVPVEDLNLTDTLIQDPLSTAPHGFNFVMTSSDAFTSLVFYDPTDGSWSFEITPQDGFQDEDELHFSSNPNDKQLYLVRGEDTIYLADVIENGSIWPIMFPYDNHLAVNHPLAVAWTEISYYPTYWGV